MLKLKITTIGSSAGVVLPKEVLARLKIEKGDYIGLSETPNGYELSPYDPDFEKAMDASRDVMRRYRNALRELAK
ncbi:AbrB/MazE/SpoVT family DNA-binding domain-containing protein [Dongia sedimenti]|uniref:AbrB/MazE/SpoVT family DNA-binding domain-containing protein n=1 Tax=Dongia sedimenti TaxID=3064282 RepID=A0ABU0YT77_9PROT|nr:AbrB/MazE/SpoVT family DNA-binding domain-containing protein [Rhodospirillaceae bacterium R-7]